MRLPRFFTRKKKLEQAPAPRTEADRMRTRQMVAKATAAKPEPASGPHRMAGPVAVTGAKGETRRVADGRKLTRPSMSKVRAARRRRNKAARVARRINRV